MEFSTEWKTPFAFRIYISDVYNLAFLYNLYNIAVLFSVH